jgi:hypothetical protein
MSTALVSPSFPTIVLYAASLLLVVWAVVDVARRPSSVIAPRSKALWIIGSVIGWLVFGIVGAVIAILYLVGPRRRLNAQRW